MTNYLSHVGNKVPIDWPKVRLAYLENPPVLSGMILGANGQPRFGRRPAGAKPWPLEDILGQIRHVVFHHSVTHSTKDTDAVLRKRNLSVHLGVDADGTIVQLLDLAVRDQSSGDWNDRGIGVEVANIVEPYGNYTWDKPPKDYVGRPVVTGMIGGVERKAYDYTPEQKAACAALAAALCAYYPMMAPSHPGVSDNSKRQELRGASARWGIIGHFHVTSDAKKGKWDPNPAFDFDRCAAAARLAVARAVLPEFFGEDPEGREVRVVPSARVVQRALQALGKDLLSGADGSASVDFDIDFAEQVAGRPGEPSAVIADDLKRLIQAPSPNPASGPGEAA